MVWFTSTKEFKQITKQLKVDSVNSRSDKVMMIVEDKTFDFLVRDRLKKECEERHLLPLSGDPRNHDQLS